MWKMSEINDVINNNRGFRILLIVEGILILLGIIGLFGRTGVVASTSPMTSAAGEEAVVLTTDLMAGTILGDTSYYIDESSGMSDVFLETQGISLSPGVYSLKVSYDAGENGSKIEVKDNTANFHSLLQNVVTLYSGINEASCQFYLLEKTDNLQVAVHYSGSGTFTVSDMQIIKSNCGSRIYLFAVIVFSLLINGLVYLYHRHDRIQQLCIAGLTSLVVLASIPIFTDYIVFGADLGFHLMRIEALVKSLTQGIIPVRIEDMWLSGHGYANSIFYCDTFLVIPAVFRLLGFTMNMSYQMYVLIVNLATVLIAYYCFKKCFDSRRIGLLGSMLYTLSPYRIYNIYNRAAVGEYTAMTFLPLFCYGFYKVFTEDVDSEGYGKNWIPLVLGFTGIIQSHVLTCEIIGGATVLLCLLLIKKVFRKKTFLVLFKTVVLTILLNVWFLIPFLDYMVSGSYRFSLNAGETIQKRGILLSHLFYTMQNAGASSRFHEAGMMDTEPVGLGIAILLGMIGYLVLRYYGKQEETSVILKERKAARTSLLLGLAVLFMSTCYFPWDKIQSLHSILGSLVSSLQFPTRLLTAATPCMVFVVCIAGVWLLRLENKVIVNVCLGVMAALCVLFSMYQTNDTLLSSKKNIIRLYSVENLGHSTVLGAEYLPLGADLLAFHYHDAIGSQGVSITAFEKDGLDTITDVIVAGDGEAQYLELPMINYKGYRAQDMDSGEVFEVTAGNNQDVRVLLPNGYQGRLHVWFQSMWYWRVAEIISLVTIILLGLGWFRRYNNPKKEDE